MDDIIRDSVLHLGIDITLYVWKKMNMIHPVQLIVIVMLKMIKL